MMTTYCPKQELRASWQGQEPMRRWIEASWWQNKGGYKEMEAFMEECDNMYVYCRSRKDEKQEQNSVVRM